MTVTNGDIGSFINAQTEDTTPDGTNDFALTYDASAAAVKKVKLGNLGTAYAYHGCALYNTTSQTVTTGGSAQAITMNTEISDTDAYHDPGTNPSRITIPVGLGGVYQINYGAQVAGSTGGTMRIIFVRKGGTTTLQGGAIKLAPNANAQTAGRSIVASLSAGDYIELCAYHDAGVSLAYGYADATDPGQVSFLSVTKIG